MSAVISPCGLYRWILGRDNLVRLVSAGRKKGTILWVMLNPSTADAIKPDPTLNRVVDFSRRFGYRELHIVNLYAYRTAFPHELWLAEDPVGVENDRWIHEAARRASVVVVAWGGNAKPDRVARVLELLQVDNPVVYCLGTNADGSPRHPLYLSKKTVLEPWALPE